MLDEFGELDISTISPEDLTKVKAVCQWVGRRLEEFNSAGDVYFNNDYVSIEVGHFEGCHCHGSTEYSECKIPNDYFFSVKSGSDFHKALEKKQKEDEEAKRKVKDAQEAVARAESEKRLLETLKKKYETDQKGT